MGPPTNHTGGLRFGSKTGVILAAQNEPKLEVSPVVYLHAGLEIRSTVPLKPVRTPVAIFGSLGVCIYGPASRHGLISYSPIHLT